MSNRQRVLSTARSCFNERGSHAVTTNHLAEEAGISVGNLYYHFRSKEEVVRHLFEELDQAWRTRLTVPDPARVTWIDIENLIAEHFRIMWEYRFFFREQTSLRQRDPVLARRWTIAHKRGRADLQHLIRAFASGIAPHARVDVAHLERITDVCWILADYWLSFKESMGTKLRQQDLDEGVKTFRTAALPMLNAALGITIEGAVAQ
ncbi:MAG TPA: TetR/AcrR family transcriptional regulator [Phycisphaerales bacterium]|nr:TetR/AcrR family transcriptional regulator [Phycisphaerales bacterium]